MKKKYKLKKSAIVIIFSFIIFIVALIILISSIFRSRSYSIDYSLEEYKISENYDDKEKIFYYEIIYKNKKYNFISKQKYKKEKKLISNITSYEEEPYTCLVIDSSYIKTPPVCSDDNQQIDAHLVSETLQEQFSTYLSYPDYQNNSYKNYQIFNTENKILIWSYKGFNYLKNGKVEEIKIFDKDIYDIPLATKINNYILIPNYEQEYSFNEMYVINLDNSKVETWKLKYSISFDSLVLGYNDKSVYILDNKNKIEYELVPHKHKMRIIAKENKQAIIYRNGEEEKISMNKLISSKETFTYKNPYHYELHNNTLYLSYLTKDNQTKVSNQNISSIIHINNENIYYLVDTTLYKYNPKYGETKLVNYYEWNFNNKNLIFIYD